MSDKRYIVPVGMLNAACDAPSAIPGFQTSMERILEAALRWLSENPIVPTSGDYLAIREDYKMSRTSLSWESYYAVEWQRRMFLAPETEVPEEIKDLVWDNRGYAQDHVMKKHKEEILEAYHRGLAAAVTKK